MSVGLAMVVVAVVVCLCGWLLLCVCGGVSVVVCL